MHLTRVAGLPGALLISAALTFTSAFPVLGGSDEDPREPVIRIVSRMQRTGRIFTVMVTHAAYDLASLAIIYWNIESEVAHLIFQ